MAVHATHEALERLEAEMSALRSRLGEQEAALAAQRAVASPRRHGGKRRARRGAALVVAGMLALTPLSIFAANPTFSDIGKAAPEHQANIQAIGNAGITTGYVDPANSGQRLFDPKANVTREEMASFLARTAGVGTNPPVVNAATVGGVPANGIARVARGVADNDFANQTGTGPFLIPTALPNYTPFVSVAIEAPTSGFVLVTGTSGASTLNTDVVYMRLRDTTMGASATAVSPQQLLFTDYKAAASGTVSTYGTLSSTYVFPVTGAGTKTFTMEFAGNNTNTGDSTAFSSSMTAIFVPFGNSGGTTLGEPATSSGTGQGVPQPFRVPASR